MPHHRLTPQPITAEEVARFEQCPLAWWYDRAHPLTHAPAPDLARRMEILRAVYGPGVAEMAEYQFLQRQHEHALARPDEPEDAPPIPAMPLGPPHWLIATVVLVGAVIIGLALAGLVFGLTQR
jgi:hypothetical protein